MAWPISVIHPVTTATHAVMGTWSKLDQQNSTLIFMG